MSDLARKKCVPCRSDAMPLKGETLIQLKEQLDEKWKLIEEHHLEKEYHLQNFRQALDLTCDIGRVAEEEGHHPEITLTWGKVKVKIWTHKVNGLSENDFILADKCDACYITRFGKLT
jgi:4a-hydroxytetrahydrobiopterin dehydratase